MAIEKRRLPRFDLKIPVAVTMLDENGGVLEVLEYTVRDISAGGAYLRSTQMLAQGAPIEVSFFLPVESQEKMKSERAHIKVSGLVVRSDEMGMGVCFDEEYEIESFF